MPTRPPRSSRPRPQCQLGVELLEGRQLLSRTPTGSPLFPPTLPVAESAPAPSEITPPPSGEVALSADHANGAPKPGSALADFVSVADRTVTGSFPEGFSVLPSPAGGQEQLPTQRIDNLSGMAAAGFWERFRSPAFE